MLSILSRSVSFLRLSGGDRSATDPQDRPWGWHPAAGAERAREGVLSRMHSLSYGLGGHAPAPQLDRQVPAPEQR